MKKEFIPYELALRMKSLGFDEPCFGWYRDKVFCYGEKDGYDDIYGIKAPTFSQAFRWFREKYGYWHYILEATKGTCRFHIDEFEGKSYTSEIYNSYEEAELSCLEKLLEIVEQQKKEV